MSSARLRQSVISKVLTVAAAGMLVVTMLLGVLTQRTPEAAATGTCTLDGAGLLTYLDDQAEASVIRPVLTSSGDYRVGSGCAAVDPSTVNAVLILARDGSNTIRLDAVNYDLAGFPIGFSMSVLGGDDDDTIRVIAEQVPAGGLSVEGDIGLDTLEVLGSSDFDLFSLSPGLIRRGTGGLISYDIDILNVFGLGAEDIFTVEGGTPEGTSTALFGGAASDQFLIEGRIAPSGLHIDADLETAPVGRGDADLAIVTLSNSADTVVFGPSSFQVTAGPAAGGVVTIDVPAEEDARLESLTFRGNAGNDVYEVTTTLHSATTTLRGDDGNDTFNVMVQNLGFGGQLQLIGNSPLYSDIITGAKSGPGDVVNFTAGAGVSRLVIDNAVLAGNDGNAAAAGMFLNGETTPRAIATLVQTVNVSSSVPTQVLDTVPLIATNVTTGTTTTHYPGVAFVTVDGTTTSSGLLAGGETATIFGTNLDQVTAVKFGTKTASFTPSTDGFSLTATVPPGDQFGRVVVTATRDFFSSFPIDGNDEFGLGFSIRSPFDPPTPSDTHTYLDGSGAPLIEVQSLPPRTLDPLHILDADGDGAIDSDDPSIDGRTLDQIAQAILDATLFGGSETLDVLVAVNGGAQVDPSALTLPVGGPFSLTWMVRANTTPPLFSQPLTQTVTVLALGDDDDGDGLTNAEEDAIGSDPTDACSPLDVNGDGTIDLADALFIISRLSQTGPALDLDQGGLQGRDCRLD